MVAAPVLSALKLSGTLFESFVAASLLAAVIPADTVRSRSPLWVLLIVAWLARPLTDWLGNRVLSAMTMGIWTLIGLLAAVAALRFAMDATKVDTEHLCAALSAYLLAGTCFGLLYWVLEQIKSGTFVFPGEFSQTSAIYFSFVTLATLGYGDIAPRTDVARGLAIVEGVGGQLFLAVLVEIGKGAGMGRGEISGGGGSFKKKKKKIALLLRLIVVASILFVNYR